MQSNLQFDENKIVQCFIHIHDPNSSSGIRKQADTFLMDCEKQLVPLMKILTFIFQNNNNNYNVQIRLQALLYLGNVIKRNWNNKRLLKTQPELPQVKKQIAGFLVNSLQQGEKIFVHSLFDIVRFIAKAEYPHAYPQLTSYVLMLILNIQINQNNVDYFKELREVFLELAQRKGFVNVKNFQEGPRKILDALGPITQTMRQQMCKQQDLSNQLAKISKYCNQIIICIMRMAPYSYLDDENFMMTIKHILNKLQTFLTAHSIQNNKNKILLQKDVKSIVYQLGCLQVANPCIMAPILSDYISTLFYIISKPQIFAKPACIKYALLSMRKLIKQFTYYADQSIFVKSISSQSKSSNYLQLRKISHEAYKQFMTEETVQGILNFLLTNIMNIKSKEDEGFIVGFDDSVGYSTGYEKSTEKDLTVHVCGTLLAESLIERFTQKMLQLIYSLLKTCIDNNWSNVDNPTLINFLSIISILPKSCKRNQINYLSQYPIITVLQFAHGSPSMGIRNKFPALISGWLDIFTNEQVRQLTQALLNYVEQGAKNNNMQILLYSCYSLNKTVMLRSAAVDSGFILHKVFPIAIKVFDQTDNPQILWPLINLISSLLNKCEFDTNVIVNSVQSNSLTALISNQSQMLIQALCEMFKSFLCIIPRNKPAVAVFKLIYHFLNIHLAKTQAIYHQKCVTLWYYSIREFSAVNQCNQEYYELFENHFQRCMFSMKPILIYILQQYMLLGLIESKLDIFIQKVIEFYREGQFIENSQQLNSNYPNQPSTQNQNNRQQGIQLKIAALSFQITLITKYKIQQVNSEQMLYIIMKDFCNIGADQTNQNSNYKIVSNTLQNSILSIINRYIMLYPDYFFEFLKSKLDITPPNFYVFYFKNMEYLTSRTALRINALALSSLLTRVNEHFKPYDPQQVVHCIMNMLKILIPQLEQQMKYLNGQQGLNAGKVQNSPTIRFSQSILSERKQKVRKQGSYEEIDLRQYFLKQFKECLDNLGMNLQNMAQILDQSQQGRDLGNRLMIICS